MKRLLNLTIFTLLFLLGTSSVLAGLNISCEPAIIRKNIMPGETATFDMIVTNTGDVPANVVGEVEDLKLSLGGENVYVLPESKDPWGASSLLSLAPAKFTLQPGETQEVSVTIEAPRNLRGGRYSVIFFKGTQPNPQGQINLAIRPGSLIFLRVPNTGIYKARITELGLSSPKQEGQAQTLLTVLKNTGNIHFSATGYAGIFDSNEELVFHADLKSQGSTLLPDGEREFKVVLPSYLPDGAYKLVVTYKFSGKKVRSERNLIVSDSTISLK